MNIIHAEFVVILGTGSPPGGISRCCTGPARLSKEIRATECGDPEFGETADETVAVMTRGKETASWRTGSSQNGPLSQPSLASANPITMVPRLLQDSSFGSFLTWSFLIRREDENHLHIAVDSLRLGPDDNRNITLDCLVNRILWSPAHKMPRLFVCVITFVNRFVA